MAARRQTNDVDILEQYHVQLINIYNIVKPNFMFVCVQIHVNVNQKICRLEIVFDKLWCPLSILLLAAIGAKLIGPHGGLQVDKKVCDVTGLRGLTQILLNLISFLTQCHVYFIYTDK